MDGNRCGSRARRLVIYWMEIMEAEEKPDFDNRELVDTLDFLIPGSLLQL